MCIIMSIVGCVLGIVFIDLELVRGLLDCNFERESFQSFMLSTVN